MKQAKLEELVLDISIVSEQWAAGEFSAEECLRDIRRKLKEPVAELLAESGLKLPDARRRKAGS